jgi:osmoprotectant transport system ATP-binding protein
MSRAVFYANSAGHPRTNQAVFYARCASIGARQITPLREMNSSTTNTGEPIIQFRGVSYAARGNGARPILDAVSLSIHRGETLVLLGKSGAGKTSLLKLINRLQVPTRGEVLVEGRATTAWDVIQLRRGIGYVIQEVGLFPHFNVARNVTLVPDLENWPKEREERRYHEVMQLVGLDPSEYARRLPNQLSGGQRQRVGVARALAADPPILLMDEPFGALDPVTRADLQREFRELAKRLAKTIVLVTHDLREALLLGSRIVLMDDGRVVADAAAEEFPGLAHPLVQKYVASQQSPVPHA